MSDTEKFARLRQDIQIIPTQYQKKTVYLIEDPLGLVPTGLILNQDTINILAVLSQCRSFQEFTYQLTRLQGGVMVNQENVTSIFQKFDDWRLLHSETFQDAKRQAIADYLKQPVRLAALAGHGYPAEKEELNRQLDIVMKNVMIASSPIPENRKVRAIIAPHIDLRVGTETYGIAYQYWPQWVPKRILLMGTGHRLSGAFFSVTTKDFETPLGVLHTDKDAVEKIRHMGGAALASNDIAHRKEHSLELQIIFIQKCLQGRKVPIIPILCGSFHSIMEAVQRPSEYLQIAVVLSALRDLTMQPDTLIVASVDLSHIGPKFGHRFDSRNLEEKARLHDREIMQSLETGDVKKLWDTVYKERDKYNVCGFSTLATLLEITGDVKGSIVDYNLWHEDATNSAVSFAAGVLWNRS